MPADRDLIAEGRRLDTRAEAAPWWIGPSGDCYAGDGSGNSPMVLENPGQRDAELIVWMRNNLPALLTALEAAQRPPTGHLVAIHHDDSTPPEPEIVYRDKPDAQRDARFRRSIRGDDWRVYEVREVQP
jgi:hypothetical protein